MILNAYRQMLELVRRMFAINFKPGRGCAEYDSANAVLMTQTIQPERRSSRRRDGTCPWGVESRCNY
jgi:hypothetical protein